MRMPLNAVKPTGRCFKLLGTLRRMPEGQTNAQPEHVSVLVVAACCYLSSLRRLS